MYITDENADRALGMLNEEMDRILATGSMDKEKLCLIGEIVDVMKDIKEIDMPEDMGNSYTGYNSYGRGGSYNSYGSYAGGGNGGYSQRRYSMRGRSMDSERDHIMSKMEQFMNQASNENERQLVRRIMDSI